MVMGRPPKYNTVEEMERLINLYFLACKVRMSGNTEIIEDLPEEDLIIINDTEGSIPTVTGLSYALNLSRQGLCEYAAKDDFSDTIKRAKQRIEIYLEEKLSGNNCTGSIFNLKNNFGWEDKKDISIDGIDIKPTINVKLTGD